ncbi:MAG: cystathionine beta-synthase, partial [Bacteroidota bacterium]
MDASKTLQFVKNVLENMPADWLNLTTHRLDIYEEKLAKSQFLSEFDRLFHDNNFATSALNELPTAYDYIRLGHPLSSVLEWTIAQLNSIKAENVISFSSKTMPILAVLRKNALEGKNTQILYTGKLPLELDSELLKGVYGYIFDLKQVENATAIPAFDGSTVFISRQEEPGSFDLVSKVDFFVSVYEDLGSVIVINGTENDPYVSEIQHVRRRESIAMTPADTLVALQHLTETPATSVKTSKVASHKKLVQQTISEITGSNVDALIASSGLSIQYAIMMGLVDDALAHHPGQVIKFLVPPNCYGGTNDQARRVAASIENVEIEDLAVDGDSDMVQSLEVLLDKMAKEDAVPYIIAEIPTNPRVEVPDLQQLKEVLTRARKTPAGTPA